MIKRILIGLGGTPFTPVAIDRAVELASRHEARIKAVTVVTADQICKLGPVPAGAVAYAKRMCENRLEVTQEQIDKSIAVLERRCSDASVDLSIERETGDPFSLIFSHARYHDLTIFGLHSLFEYRLVNEPEKVLLRLLSGGVRPILAVSDKLLEIKRVMMTYSGSMESANAIKHFLRLKAWPDAGLHIVYIGDDLQENRSMLADAAAYCADHGYTVSTELLPGPVSKQLLPAARKIDADIIVMGRSTRSLLVQRVLGDTVLKTLTQTHRPLFLSQ